MALENDDLIIVQKGDGSHAKATVGSARVTTPNLQAVTDVGSETTNQITSAGAKNSALNFTSNDGEGYNLQNDGRLFLQIKSSKGSSFSIVEAYRGSNKRFDISGNGRITGGQNLQDSDTKVTNYEISPNGSAMFAGRVTAAGYDLASLNPLP